jgi:hypothetical protein
LEKDTYWRQESISRHRTKIGLPRLPESRDSYNPVSDYTATLFHYLCCPSVWISSVSDIGLGSFQWFFFTCHSCGKIDLFPVVWKVTPKNPSRFVLSDLKLCGHKCSLTIKYIAVF